MTIPYHPPEELCREPSLVLCGIYTGRMRRKCHKYEIYVLFLFLMTILYHNIIKITEMFDILGTKYHINTLKNNA